MYFYAVEKKINMRDVNQSVLFKYVCVYIILL